MEICEERDIVDEITSSVSAYARAVVRERALADVRDGLKPVQRRILWSMHREGLLSSGRHVKCARIVGDVMGRYHPHGDQAIYDALTRLAQPFSTSHPLVDFHGNYGSPDMGAAASRYTEARLSSFCEQVVLDGCSSPAVPKVRNYDGSTSEPVFLPARLPLILVNGTYGIAVGFSAHIPPHNLRELASVLPDVTAGDLPTSALLEVVRGPDFPTGGQLVCDPASLLSLYEEGRGEVTVRAGWELRTPRELVFSSFPWQVGTNQVMRGVANLALPDVEAVFDMSSAGRGEVCFRLRRNADVEGVLATLFSKTALQVRLSFSFRALDGGVPRLLPFQALLRRWFEERMVWERKVLEVRLEEVEEELQVSAVRRLLAERGEEVVALVRGGGDLREKFGISSFQASRLLSLPISAAAPDLPGLDRERAALEKEKERVEKLLGSPTRLRRHILEEVNRLAVAHGRDRRTSVT